MDALEAFEDKWITYPRNSIEYKSGIPIPVNKRNGRNQKDHVRRITALRDFDYPDGTWRNRNGRPIMKDRVLEWQRQHPDGRKCDCIRETGMSRSTVDKYWNSR